MRKLLLATVIGFTVIISSGILCSAQNSGQFEIPRYPIDIAGVIQDVDGSPLDNVTLHVRTEYPTVPFTNEAERKYHRLNVNSHFNVQLTPGTFSMTIVAEKDGYARTSEYFFKADQLSAKDVVIRFIPAVRPSRLETGLAWSEITKENKVLGFSFKEYQEIQIQGTPAPTNMCVYIEIIGSPVSFADTNSYSIALMGAGIEFCETLLLPSLKYIRNHQRFADELLQAPENGYVSQIEVNAPQDLRNRIFYFKTQDEQYGKFWIENHHVYVRDNYLKIKFKYYFQPDGTRDLAAEVILAPQDITPPVTTNDYRFDGVWINRDAHITLTAVDDSSGVAHTYYAMDSGAQQEGTSIIISDEGDHVVKYWSVDNAGNTETQKSISVKIDKTPPTVDAGKNIKIAMTSPQGAKTNITPTVTDNFDPNPRIIFNAPDIFPLGTTNIIVTAIDHAGNAASDTVQVTVYLQLSVGNIKIVPSVINTRCRDGIILAMIRDVGMEFSIYDIDTSSLALGNPFNDTKVKARWVRFFPHKLWQKCFKKRKPLLLAAFSRKAIIASLGGHFGDIRLTISGNIAMGTFEGNSKVKVTKPKWFEYLISLFARERKEIVAQERKGLSADELTYLTLSEDADNLSRKTSGIKTKIPAISKPNICSEIIQLSDDPSAYVEFQTMRKETGETNEGYVKRLTIRGCPAIELYDKNSRKSQIQALVKDSYILKLEAEPPVTLQALRAYAEQISAKIFY